MMDKELKIKVKEWLSYHIKDVESIEILPQMTSQGLVINFYDKDTWEDLPFLLNTKMVKQIQSGKNIKKVVLDKNINLKINITDVQVTPSHLDFSICVYEVTDEIQKWIKYWDLPTKKSGNFTNINIENQNLNTIFETNETFKYVTNVR